MIVVRIIITTIKSSIEWCNTQIGFGLLLRSQAGAWEREGSWLDTIYLSDGRLELNVWEREYI